MTIEHMDNFSIYGTVEALLDDGIYAFWEGAGGPVADPDGISSGFVLQVSRTLTNGTFDNMRYALRTGAVSTVGVALRLWMPGLPDQDGAVPYFVWIKDVGNNPLAYLQPMSNGRLQVVVQGGGSYPTVLPVVTANGWWHIEFKYTSNGLGQVSFEVRVEGQTVITQAGVAGPAALPGQIAQGGRNIGATLQSPGSVYIKDYVIWNSLGAVNNDFLGSVLVHNLVPTADVALNWAPTPAGTGFSILDNIPPNDAQYITAINPPPAAYVCELSNLPADVTSVKGIMSFVRAAKTDGGDGSLQVGVISNGDTALGADRPITVTQTYWRDLFESDPDTLAPWLPAAVNAVQLQINRTL